MKITPEGKICSFCGVEGTKRTKFAGGLGALICVPCIERYSEILASATRAKAITKPPWDGVPTSDLVDKLPSIARSGDQAHDFLVQWVAVLRDRKVSWADIGRALGVSRQAAWERFAGALEERSDAS